MPYPAMAAYTMKKQPHSASAGMKKRLKPFRSRALRMNWTNMTTYMPYSVMIGSSDESKQKGPNQPEVRFAP